MRKILEYNEYTKNKMKNIVDNILLTKKGGKDYFNIIDNTLKLTKNVDLIQYIFNEINKYNDFNIILSGGFGDWILSQIKKGNLLKPKNLIHVNGSIRGRNNKLNKYTIGDDVFINYKYGNIYNKNFILFDDSYYSGSTEQAIKKFLKKYNSYIIKTYILYDGSEKKDKNRYSLYRYYDYYNGNELEIKKLLNYLYDINISVPLSNIEKNIINGKIKTIKQINNYINYLLKKYNKNKHILLNYNDELKYESIIKY